MSCNAITQGDCTQSNTTFLFKNVVIMFQKTISDNVTRGVFYMDLREIN